MATSCRNIYVILHLFHPLISKIELFVSCSLGGIFMQVCPLGRDRAGIHETNGQKSIIEDHMILWQDATSAWIKNKSNISGVKGGVPQIYAGTT